MRLTVIQNVKQLQEMDWCEFTDHLLERDELEHALGLVDCFWQHDGDMRRPHAELSAGGCSDTFIDLGTMLKKYDGVRALVAWNLIMLIPDDIRSQITRVVGSDTSATALAGTVAQLLRVKHDRMQKVDDASGKRQLWLPENGLISEDDQEQQVEELTTTGNTPQMVHDGVLAGNPQLTEVRFSPILPMAVDRTMPQVTHVEGSTIVAIVRYEAHNYLPDNCPLCQAGSPKLRPRKDNNWALLTGKAA